MQGSYASLEIVNLFELIANWYQANGPVLLLLLVFAATLYWQLADLLSQFRCSGSYCCWQCRQHKCAQLMAWVSVAPLMGLLGTVHGLLGSFEILASGQSGNITQGMAQALITTEVGLAVAIPAWILLLLGQQHCKLKLEQA